MNNLILVKNGATLTTSLVIAEGVEIQHKNVMEQVRKYQTDLNEFGEVAFETRLNKQGSSTEYALLNEHHATLLLTYMRNTDIVREFKKRLVKAFFEMAGRLANPNTPAFTIPQTLPEALRLAADLADKNTQLEHKVEEMKPKVEALDRIATADGSVMLTEAAKVLQTQVCKLTKYLQREQWAYRRNGNRNLMAYQHRIHAGLLEHKVSVYPHPHTGEDEMSYQLLITPKGLARLAEEMSTKV